MAKNLRNFKISLFLTGSRERWLPHRGRANQRWSLRSVPVGPFESVGGTDAFSPGMIDWSGWVGCKCGISWWAHLVQRLGSLFHPGYPYFSKVRLIIGFDWRPAALLPIVRINHEFQHLAQNGLMDGRKLVLGAAHHIHYSRSLSKLAPAHVGHYQVHVFELRTGQFDFARRHFEMWKLQFGICNWVLKYVFVSDFVVGAYFDL